MSGKLLRLFLVDGKPTGLRTVEVSNMTLQATLFPRTRIDAFLQRDAARKPAVYMLIGPDVDDPERTRLYIGEADPMEPRIKDHHRKKDFWTEAFVFSAKDDYLTKTQVKYLEAKLYSLAVDAHRAVLDNSQTPTTPNISEADEAEVLEFLDGIKLVLSALGVDVLEPRTYEQPLPRTPVQPFTMTHKQARGQMIISGDEYVVLAGSTAVRKEQPSCPGPLKKLRRELVESGILVPDENDQLYRFKQNAKFSSPSYAAGAIVGGAVNGRRAWTLNGRPLGDVEEQQA